MEQRQQGNSCPRASEDPQKVETLLWLLHKSSGVYVESEVIVLVHTREREVTLY